MAAQEHPAAEKIAAFAPGRIEVLGNHTDYNQGLVLGAAIDRGLQVAGNRRNDDSIRLHSQLTGAIEVALSDLHPLAESSWGNYALGVVSELIQLGIPIGGFTAEVTGDLPAGSGLSSSAAFEIATALFLLKLSGRQLQPMEIAKACQRAEHHFVGVRSGLLDQVVSLFGREDHLVFFDTRSEAVELVAFPADLAVIVAESGIQRKLSHGEYNIRRDECFAAARALGIDSLRDITPAELERRSDLPDLLRRRALHVVGENERVRQAIDFLAKGDSEGFGSLLNASHESSRENFENSTPELDLLVELARKLPGVLGARLTGAGFGGATITLCQKKEAVTIGKRLSAAYAERTGITSQVYVCSIGSGAA